MIIRADRRDLELQKRALRDVAKRSTAGIFIYVGIWIPQLIFGGVYRTHAVLAYSYLALFVMTGLARLLFELRVDRLIERNFTGARALFIGLAVWSSLHWGTLAAICVIYPDLNLEVPMLICTVCVTAAGTYAFAIDRLLRFLFPIAMATPIAVTMLLDPTPTHQLLSVMLPVFVFYVVYASRLVSSDYWELATYRLRLERRAKIFEEKSITDAHRHTQSNVFR